MSVAPKIAVFAKKTASRGAVDTSINLPAIGVGKQKPAPLKPGTGMAPLSNIQKKKFQFEVAPGVQRQQPERRETAPSKRFSTGDAKREHYKRQTESLVNRSESEPVWLTWLIQWQRRSSILTFLLVSATLAVYGGTVYTQQLWNREYRQLETLQLQQRQLTAASEALKHQLAIEAERQDAGLVPATPSNNVFLPAQQQPLATPSNAPVTNSASKPQLTPTPLGY